MLRLLRSPATLLRIEGAVVLAAALYFYAQASNGWLMFILLILAPDLSMVGYLGGVKVGAATYNAIHIYLWPAILAIYGLTASNPTALSISLIWFAHIGADRLLGFGLKYPTEFKDTHLQHA
jgi:hypothetical protein